MGFRRDNNFNQQVWGVKKFCSLLVGCLFLLEDGEFFIFKKIMMDLEGVSFLGWCLGHQK